MSIEERALLTKLRIRVPGGTKTERAISEKVANENNAMATAGRYSKTILKSPFMDEFRRVANKARDKHYKFTSPWLDDGRRVLPSKLFIRYRDAMSEIKMEADRAADRIVGLLDQIKSSDKHRLGKMYNDEDYPSPDEFRDMFGVEISFLPMPSGSDWRVDVGEKEREMLRAQVEDQMKEFYANALREAWERLHAATERLVKRLSADSRLHESTLNNLKELVELLPALNVMQDPNLDSMAKEVEKAIANQDVTVLRSDDEKRHQVSEELAALQDKMAAFLPKQQ